MVHGLRARLVAAGVMVCLPAAIAAGQGGAAAPAPAQQPDTVRAILPPTTPIPPEVASARVTKFSFIVYGDTRGRQDGVNLQYEHAMVVESMVRTITSMRAGPDPVKFVLQSGDAVVNGRDAAQWNVSFTGLINGITATAGVPYFLAPGNHDVTSASDLNAPGRQAGLRNYLAAMAKLIPADGATRRLAGYPTYAFAYGNTFVLALDSNIPDDSTQFAWARRQLEGLDRRRFTHIVAFFHHPPFSSGPHGGPTVERPSATIRQLWMPLFRKQGVNLVFTGHEHLFEHWVERWRDERGRWHRMDQVVSGGGGAPLYAYTGEPETRMYLTAGAADSLRLQHLVKPGPNPGDNPYHYVVVHVDGPRVWMDVVGVDWGRGFAPYRTARAILGDSARAP